MSRSLAPGLPSAAAWHLAELRYNRVANCLVALLLHRRRSGEGRVYVRPLMARRYRRIRIARTRVSHLSIASAASAPVLFVNALRGSRPRGWDWDRLVAVDLRTAQVRLLRWSGDQQGEYRTWVSELLGCDVGGRKLYMRFARERPMTAEEFRRMKARLRRQGMVVHAAKARRRHATHVDYLLSEYSVRDGRVRDIALLPHVFA